MEIHQLKYVVAVAETRNFTRAADKCGVSQPSLTKAIRKLEEELGGPLFRREGRHTHLTELGRAVIPRLEQALQLTELAQRDALDMAALRSARMKVGCMCTIAPSSVMSLIEFFQREVPELNMHLRDGSGEQMITMLQEGEIDVALTALPRYPDDLSVKPLFREPYVVTFPAGHRFAEMAEVPFAELEQERYLERVNCEYLSFLQEAGYSDKGEEDPPFRSEHESWIQAMVIAGLGCSIMPMSLAQHPGLTWRPLVAPAIERTVSVITKRGRRHTPAVNVFVKLCQSIRWQESGDTVG